MSEAFEDALNIETGAPPAAASEPLPAAQDGDQDDDVSDLAGSMTEADLDAARATYSAAELAAIADKARQVSAPMLDESQDAGRREVGEACDAFIASQDAPATADQEQDAEADARARAAVANIFAQPRQGPAPTPATSMSNIFGQVVEDDIDVKDVASRAATKAASSIAARAPDVARASKDAAAKSATAAMEAAAAARRAAGEMARKSMHRIPWRRVGIIGGAAIVLGIAAFAGVHLLHAHNAAPAAPPASSAYGAPALQVAPSKAPAASAPTPPPAPAAQPRAGYDLPAPAPNAPSGYDTPASAPKAPSGYDAPAPVQPKPVVQAAPAPNTAVPPAPVNQNSAAAEIRTPVHHHTAAAAPPAKPARKIDAKAKAQIQALENFFKKNGGGH